eukprot:GHVL01012631.1.p2 GENE.GHVL01012631.1~~GHVL01012631.1.p2  ORF type:complete len:555 (+),score=74.72 GHVL01012631.1:59-1723(+)
MASIIQNCKIFGELKRKADEFKTSVLLRDLLKDERRNSELIATHQDVRLDFSHECLDTQTLDSLFKLADEMDVKGKIEEMFNGSKINTTENRAVLHVALRGKAEEKMFVDEKDVTPEIHNVLARIRRFSTSVREGQVTGYTGKPLKDMIVVGIGGSHLGVEFVCEAIKGHEDSIVGCEGRRIRFLANVDPIDLKACLDNFRPETTLVVVVSKTFTTAETIKNANLVKDWLLQSLRHENAIASHVVAVSTSITETSKFGINPNNVFGIWDWVGGRFSVTSAVGVLPLALHFGWNVVMRFLAGAHSCDENLRTAPYKENIPFLLGLLSVWNTTFMGRSSHAVIPYCQALHRLPAHIQQVSMESSGKGVNINGEALLDEAGEIEFGEPGTNAQHSFFQLMHQGRVIPVDFIGFCKPQPPMQPKWARNHDELMTNMFAQADALALGRTKEECEAAGIPCHLVPHQTFNGNRSSLCLLLPVCDPFYVGYITALYEHRTAVKGFLWNINSFDQMGVELGKTVANDIRAYISSKRLGQTPVKPNMLLSTTKLVDYYLKNHP